MESAEKTAWLSISVNLVLVGIKTAVTLLSGSLAVRADVFHSLADVISSVIILIGIKISERTVRGFPYGLYKVENLVAMVTSVLILFAGYEILKAVFAGATKPLPSQIPLSLLGIVATILITWTFSRYEEKIGKEIGSPSLIADARHVWTDMLSSFVILTAFLGSAIGFAIDAYAAVIVVFFVVRSALSLLIDSVRVLLDASLDYKSIDRIREVVLADPRVAELNNIWARNAGRYKFVELDITLSIYELRKGHRVSEEIENRVRMALPQVDRILIHFQPKQQDFLVFSLPLNDDRQTISDHFGEAPYFRLITIKQKEKKIVKEQFLQNPFLQENKAKGIKVANWLVQNGVDILISRHDYAGKGPGFVLGNAGREIVLTTECHADQALAEVLTYRYGETS